MRYIEIMEIMKIMKVALCAFPLFCNNGCRSLIVKHFQSHSLIVAGLELLHCAPGSGWKERREQEATRAQRVAGQLTACPSVWQPTRPSTRLPDIPRRWFHSRLHSWLQYKVIRSISDGHSENGKMGKPAISMISTGLSQPITVFFQPPEHKIF